MKPQVSLSNRGLGIAGAVALLALISSVSFAGILPVMIFCLMIGIALGLLWLILRGWVQSADLPDTGIEIFLLLAILGVVLSAVFSPAPRLGLEEIAWYLFYALIFFVLLDLSDRPAARSALRGALLGVSGLLLLAALLETYAWYTNWWASVGSTQINPPYTYRFTSLAGHSSFLMALANLCAPLALVTFLRTRSRAARIANAFWLILYVSCLPFASSRAGWIGTAVWGLTLAALWLREKQRWQRALQIFQKKIKLLLPAALLLLALGGAGAFWFYRTFAMNPTHGEGVSLNRGLMWENALKLWAASPWFGIGPGRLGLEYLRVTQNFPTDFWPWHAHSMPLQILAETGLAGFLPTVGLVGLILWKVYQAYRKTPVEERPWSMAALAALAAFAVQAIFDNFNLTTFVMVPVLFHVANLLCAPGPISRSSQSRASVLWVPGLLITIVALFHLWENAPLYQARQLASQGQWRSAAQAAEQSIQRDPSFSLFYAQAGLAWARVWEQTRDPQTLELARQRLSQGLKMEPNNSLLWAALAALEDQRGQTQLALNDIQKAMTLAPREPSFPLNAGWYLEQLGRMDEASTQYQRALELDPLTATHPFWKATPLRQKVLQSLPASADRESPHWLLAQQQIEAGLSQTKASPAANLPKAQIELALARLAHESAPAIDIVQYQLETAKGNPAAAQNELIHAQKDLDEIYWQADNAEFFYTLYFGRRGIQQMAAPGYLRLNPDFGQFSALQTLYTSQVNAGDCQAAAQTWATLQRERSGGFHPAYEDAALPTCP